MSSTLNTLKHYRPTQLLASTCAVIAVSAAFAAPPPPPPPALSEFPLAWSDQVIPNFLITLDDSRSMMWGFLPDTIFADVSQKFDPLTGLPVLDVNGNATANYPLQVHAKSHNAVAYDPAVVLNASIVAVEGLEVFEAPALRLRVTTVGTGFGRIVCSGKIENTAPEIA